MKPKSDLQKMAEEHTKQIRKTKKKLKNLLLRNLIRTNRTLRQSLDLSNVVLF